MFQSNAAENIGINLLRRQSQANFQQDLQAQAT